MIRHKYNATKYYEDSYKFDSKLEANVYKELKDTPETAIIELQPAFTLLDGFRYQNKAYRPLKYIADFKIEHKGQEYIIDVKGFETPVYKIKKKLLLNKYPDINFIEIKSVKALKYWVNN